MIEGWTDRTSVLLLFMMSCSDVGRGSKTFVLIESSITTLFVHENGTSLREFVYENGTSLRDSVKSMAKLNCLGVPYPKGIYEGLRL